MGQCRFSDGYCLIFLLGENSIYKLKKNKFWGDFLFISTAHTLLLYPWCECYLEIQFEVELQMEAASGRYFCYSLFYVV